LFESSSDNLDLSNNTSDIQQQLNDAGITMLSFNARSLKDPKKRHVFSSWLNTMKSSSVCINETWLNDNIKTSEIFDDYDYVVFRNDRISGRGGGVLLANKSHLYPNRLETVENDAELVWAEIKVNGKKYLISSAYRSPSNSDTDNKNLLDSLHLIVSSLISDKYEACFIAGDLNLQIDWNSSVPRPHVPLSNSFLSCFYDFVPNQLVTTPTSTVNNTSNILDLFLCDNLDALKLVEVIPGIKDHEAVMCYGYPQPV
jgi:hypothetical protein